MKHGRRPFAPLTPRTGANQSVVRDHVGRDALLARGDRRVERDHVGLETARLQFVEEQQQLLRAAQGEDGNEAGAVLLLAVALAILSWASQRSPSISYSDNRDQ